MCENVAVVHPLPPLYSSVVSTPSNIPLPTPCLELSQSGGKLSITSVIIIIPICVLNSPSGVFWGCLVGLSCLES